MCHFGHRPLRSSALATIACLGLGCSDFEIPTAPDMSALSRAYSEPNGEITAETAQGLGTEVVSTVGEAREDSPLEIAGSLVDNLQEVGDSETDAETDDSSKPLLRNVDVAAVARLHHTCGGWEASASEPNARGSVHVTATLDSDGVIPTAWGNFEHCRFERGAADIELDGALRIHFGENQRRVSFASLARTKYLFEYEGHVVTEVDGVHSEFELHSHFRVTETRQVQFLIGLEDGTNVIGVFEPLDLDPLYGPSLLTMGLLTRDSSWTCSVDLADASGSCTDADDPTSVVSW